MSISAHYVWGMGSKWGTRIFSEFLLNSFLNSWTWEDWYRSNISGREQFLSPHTCCCASSTLPVSLACLPCHSPLLCLSPALTPSTQWACYATDILHAKSLALGISQYNVCCHHWVAEKYPSIFGSRSRCFSSHQSLGSSLSRTGVY